MSPKDALISNLQKDYGLDIDGVVIDIKRYMPELNEKKFRMAFEFAAKAHDGQTRKDGSPYITHPFETARILTSLHVDEDALIAAFMHDVPEDTTHTIAEIEEKFGKKVAYLVDGITKLAKVHYQNDMEHRQIESLKKLFIHTAKDPRIILIKLADRLHNMRTLHFIQNEQKRVRISRETLEIFVPIANLLGIEELKTELEDLCFKYLFPDEYMSLQDRMRRTRDRNQQMLDQTIEMIDFEFKKQRISATIIGRQGNLYSIYKKVTSGTKRLDEYDELIPLRILVQDTEECYKVLGIIHALFKPKPGKFKDYIAVPKVNGYQSLHTTVFGIHGSTTEVQVRTHSMHLEAEYGVAAHYFYTAQKNRKHVLEEDKRSYWVNKILQIEKVQDLDDEFMEDLKRDVFKDRIFVFTPKGKTVDLPQDATCIDFAYHIHTEVGNHALKADVNGNIEPMATVLQNGDTVRIITSDLPKGPSRSWLQFAKTSAAKNRIRDYFKRTTREVKLNTGKMMMQKELDRAGGGILREIPQKKFKDFFERHAHLKNIDEVLIAIGEGSLRTVDVISAIYPQKSTISGFLKFFEKRTISSVQKFTPVAIKIVSKDAVGQLEKILKVASTLQINILQTNAYISYWSKDFVCKQLIAGENFSRVSELFENLEQIDGVKRVERLFWKRRLFFIIGMIITFCAWALHPFILHYLAVSLPHENDTVVMSPLLYASLFMLFLVVLMMKNLAQRSFPEFRETGAFWALTYSISIFATITLLAELYFFKLNFNGLIVGGLIALIFAYLTSEYWAYRRRVKSL
jgi:GTP pyrophosphokinase